MNTQIFSKTISPRMASMSSPLEVWFYGLLNAGLVGGATSIVSAGGLAAARGFGVADIQPVNLHTLGIIFTSGAIAKLAAYASQGLPSLSKNDPQINPLDHEPPK